MANGVDLISQIPPELLKNVDTLVTLFQIFGGVIIIYLVFGIINFVLNRKKNLELKKINENLGEIKKLLKRSLQK
ncbi:hypothetical protein J4474_03630 [Candidatus Pacearchaeota archaeon]|nr:hypothetical protein [Candidatus Pacearchaeota archaeon]